MACTILCRFKYLLKAVSVSVDTVSKGFHFYVEIAARAESKEAFDERRGLCLENKDH